MKQLQFIGITPEQQTAAIVGEVAKQFEQLKTEFQPREPEEWLSVNETIEMLKISRSTLHEWTKKGTLTAYGLSTRVYYRRSEIESSLIKIN